jgi:hypothetical protein
MWLPPYFGNYEHFVKALLHNPFPGSSRSEPQPQPWFFRGEPEPQPWHAFNPDPVPWAVAFLVSAASVKETASTMANKAAAEQVVATASAAISQFLDDYCGTPPRAIPWPFPGPPPWVSVIASQLTAVANTLEEGNLRTDLFQLAGQVLDQGFAQKAVGATAGVARK